jgi:hypothetical protein
MHTRSMRAAAGTQSSRQSVLRSDLSRGSACLHQLQNRGFRDSSRLVAAAAQMDAVSPMWSGEDFYSILGLVRDQQQQPVRHCMCCLAVSATLH